MRNRFALSMVAWAGVLGALCGCEKRAQVSRVESAVLSADVAGIVTGGGTVVVTGVPENVLASFGLNARRPPGFTGGGAATGRINYDKHADVAGRHVNVPVVLMEGEISANPTPLNR